MIRENTPIATKFVSWGVCNLNQLKDTRAYILRQKLNEKQRLSRAEKNWITYQVNHNSYFKNAIPLMGYRFDFSDILKTFLVLQHQQWQEYKAVDRTSLRAMLYGKICLIIEIKKP
ncbi:molybdenum ABC transporter ATP-binding protein [Capnocytophaga canimorsus]|uniref:molybdenum ABC transporter ATP-binding protein n=1 Tax=Capnocytophaga canimorsus TaxID=28188 RepID=UPI00157732B8|nr:molybdenum ABC transporter ATP-binding protein [Capnocytophaga canimorsus]